MRKSIILLTILVLLSVSALGLPADNDYYWDGTWNFSYGGGIEGIGTKITVFGVGDSSCKCASDYIPVTGSTGYWYGYTVNTPGLDFIYEDCESLDTYTCNDYSGAGCADCSGYTGSTWDEISTECQGACMGMFAYCTTNNDGFNQTGIDCHLDLETGQLAHINTTNASLLACDEGGAVISSLGSSDASFGTNILTCTEPNDPPNITGIPDNFTYEDTLPWWEIDLWDYATDIQDTDNELSFSVSSQTNSGLISCSVRVDRYLNCSMPASDQSGFNDVTVQVEDHNGATDTDIVRISVLPVNDPPIIQNCANKSVSEDGNPADDWINLDICTSDVDNITAELTWTIFGQSNPGLINCVISSGHYIDCANPAANQTGENVLDVNVTDGDGWNTTQIKIEVTEENDNPFWSSYPLNHTIAEDSGNHDLVNLSEYSSDIDNSTDELTFVVSSENTGELECSIAGTNLTVDTVSDWNGVAVCGVQVYDGIGYSAEHLVYITVTEVNDPPSIYNCNNPVVNEDDYPPNHLVNLDSCTDDIDNSTDELFWDVMSQSNSSLIDCTVVDSYYLNCSAPAPDKVGVNTVNVSVTDGEYYGYTLINVTVADLNDIPFWGTDIPNQTIVEDSGLNNLINLSIYANDTDNVTEDFTFDITNEDTKEIDCGIIDQNLTATPAANFTGLASCNVRIYDQVNYSDSYTVYINVTNVNDAPFMDSLVLNQTTGKNGTHLLVTSSGAGDIDSPSYFMKCGSSSGNYDFCTGSIGSGERSCSFVTPWTDDSTHTIYCVLNDTQDISSEKTVIFNSDNTAPGSQTINNLEGDTVPKYWDTDDDSNTIVQLNLAESGMECRWSIFDIDYDSMDSSDSCSVAGTLASCNLSINGQTNKTERYVACRDIYGNGQNASENTDVVFGVDWTVPSVNDDNDGEIHLPGYNVTLTMRDKPEGTIITVDYCNDSSGTCSPYIEWTGTNGSQKTLTFMDRGLWYLRWNAVDDAGNLNNTKQTIVFINTLPSISAQDYDNQSGHSFTVEADISDSVGSSQSSNYSCTLYYKNSTGNYFNKNMELISGTATNGRYSSNISVNDGFYVFEEITTYINCTDGMEWDISTIDSNHIPNIFPIAPVVEISPQFPGVDADLFCNITVNSTDPDGDDVLGYHYEWHKDGISQGIYSDFLGSGNTTKGEKWRCYVTPYDAYENGTVSSDEVEVGNTAPRFRNDNHILNITWEEDTSYQNLNLSQHFYDIDGDNLTYHFTNINDITVQINHTSGKVIFIPDANFTGIRNISFNATDGVLWSGHSNVVILNVTNVNDAPYFDPPIGGLSGDENETFSHDIDATDIDPTSDNLTFYSNSTLFVINSSNGQFSFFANSSHVGHHSINFTVCDNNGECDEEIVDLEIINTINDVTFRVTDTLNGLPIDEVTVTGGSTCSGGCFFNHTLTVIEPVGPATYTFTKPGFSTEVANRNILNDTEINVSLYDVEPPVIIWQNVTTSLSNVSEGFMIDVSAKITDNVHVENVSFAYTLSMGRDETGTLYLSNKSEDIFEGSIGPFNETKFFMTSQMTAYDSYGNSDSDIYGDVWFIYQSGNATIYTGTGNNTSPMIDGIIPDQKRSFAQGPWSFDLSSYATDEQDDPSALEWSVVGVNDLFMEVSFNQTTDVITFTPMQNVSGMDRIVLVLTDSEGLVDTQEIVVSINRTLEFREGWNLFSVPIVENNSVEYLLAPLGNGNFGCGHDDVPPYDCVPADGDFEGNWTMLWTQDSSGNWIYFRPDVYYHYLDDQDVKKMEVDKGYWIEMTSPMTLTISYE